MRVQRALLILVVCLVSSSCFKTWEPSTLSPRQAIEEAPSQVRITTADGVRTVAKDPALSGDEIIFTTRTRDCLERPDGSVGGACTTAAEDHAIALSDVQTVEHRRSNTGLNVLVWGGAIVGLLAVTVAQSGGLFLCC